MGRFEGKVVAITGGSKGIGRAIALRLSSEGASIAFSWFRDGKAAEKMQIELEERGVRAVAVQAFLGDEDAPARFIDSARAELGEPSILVSNAATGVQRPLMEIKKSHLDWTMETNVNALLRLVQAGAAWESILALSSMGSSRVIPNYGVVGASKSAIETLIRYLAFELAPGCRANTIVAGAVDTDSLRKFPAAEAILSEAKVKTPAGRVVQPEDVASVAAFLLSEDASMITGQTVVVDGGYSLVS